MPECIMCGWQPEREPAHVWTIEAEGVLPSCNMLGANTKEGHKYRNWRRFFTKVLADQLNAVPRATKFRAGIITRLWGAGKRTYDQKNFEWGQKPLVDVLTNFAVILDDKPSTWRGYYRQERSADGVDRFRVQLLEYA
jgi:hypothetical protein